MSYTANAKALQKQIAQMAKTDPVWLERIKTIKAKGINGWDCIHQAVEDYFVEQQADEKEKEQLNRVEIAFNRLEPEQKEILLNFASVISAMRGNSFRVDCELRFFDFTEQERSCIAAALQRMQAVRRSFPSNLMSYEFFKGH